MTKGGSSAVEIDALLLLRRGPIGLFAIQALHRLHRRDVSRIAQRLARKGWARLEPDPEDRRARRLVLTPKGRGLADVLSCDRWKASGVITITLPTEVATGVVQALVYQRATTGLPPQQGALLEALLAQSGSPKQVTAE